MDILREKGKPYLLSLFGIIRCMDFEFPACRGEGDLVYALFDILRLKIVVNAEIYGFIFITELPALCSGPGLQICIKSCDSVISSTVLKKLNAMTPSFAFSFLTNG